MARIDLHVSVDAAREHVILTMQQAGAGTARILLDASAVQEHVRLVGRARALLSDGVSSALDLGSRVEATTLPTWAIDPQPDGPALLLRHPGFGWLAFLLSSHEAEALAQHLLRSVRSGA